MTDGPGIKIIVNIKHHIGEVSGNLKIVARSDPPRRDNRTMWDVYCDWCGVVKSMRSDHFIRDKSCGCVRDKLSGKSNIIHGAAVNGGVTSEYKAWTYMKKRCYSTKYDFYKCYGGRGIKVCDEWLHDFQAFFDHIGPRPEKGYSVDRINPDGNYEPGNVRWATVEQQVNNKSKVKRFNAR